MAIMRCILVGLVPVYSFELLSGSCELYTPPAFPNPEDASAIGPSAGFWTTFPRMRERAMCIRNANGTGNDCRFRLDPSGLALHLKRFDTCCGASLKIDGALFTGTKGPAGVVADGVMEWRGNGSGSAFELCRPEMPLHMYWAFFVILAVCFSTTCLSCLWSRVQTLALYILFQLLVMAILWLLVTGPIDGYVFEDTMYAEGSRHF